VRAVGALAGFAAGVAGDRAGSVWAALRVRDQIVRYAPDGTSSPFAGTGTPGHSGDGGPATAAETIGPDGVAVDASGNVYFTESALVGTFFAGGLLGAGEYVRAVDAAGTIRTIAGNGAYGTAGIDGPALDAQLAAPYSVAVLGDGSLA